MRDFNYLLGQDALVNQRNVLGSFTDLLETPENRMRLLNLCERNYLYDANSFFLKT